MDFNSSILAIIEPLIESTQSMVGFVKVIFGGIFGLYIVLVILRWHEIRMLRHVTSEIREEVKIIKQSVKEIKKIENTTRKNNKSKKSRKNKK